MLFENLSSLLRIHKLLKAKITKITKMCGIIGYIGEKEANDILLSGLEKWEYRGYDSDLTPSENRFSYKRTGSNQNMNSDVQKLKDIQPSEEGMNILNFMNSEDYYCRISP